MVEGANNYRMIERPISRGLSGASRGSWSKRDQPLSSGGRGGGGGRKEAVRSAVRRRGSRRRSRQRSRIGNGLAGFGGNLGAACVLGWSRVEERRRRGFWVGGERGCGRCCALGQTANPGSIFPIAMTSRPTHSRDATLVHRRPRNPRLRSSAAPQLQRPSHPTFPFSASGCLPLAAPLRLSRSRPLSPGLCLPPCRLDRRPWNYWRARQYCLPPSAHTPSATPVSILPALPFFFSLSLGDRPEWRKPLPRPPDHLGWGFVSTVT